MKKRSIGSLLFIVLVLVIMYLPIAVVVVYSFNANTARIPIDFTGWTTAWYGKLFENRSGFGDALLLSVRVALWAVAISGSGAAVADRVAANKRWIRRMGHPPVIGERGKPAVYSALAKVMLRGWRIFRSQS